jgi:hypothetical protein
LSGLNDWFAIFAVIAFFIGFLPAYIYESIKEMRPAAAPVVEAKSQAPAPQLSTFTPDEIVSQYSTDPQPLYVGKIYTSIGCNCSVRVKSIKAQPKPQRKPVEMPETLLIHYILN